MAKHPTTAATYGRQSKAREDDSAASTLGQKTKTGALVALRDWAHVGHFEDVGRSGYDPAAKRPGLDALLAAVRAGEVKRVVVWKLDRLTRQGVVEATRLVRELREHGAELVSVEEPWLDTSTAMGLGIFGLIAAMAEQESENISTRTRGAKATLRKAGSWSGGNPPYGLTTVKKSRGGLTLTTLRREPTEAPVIAHAIHRILTEGSSGHGEVVRLNAEGIPTRSGGSWTTGTLIRCLRSPALAGWLPERRMREGSRHYDTVPARDEDGAPVTVGEAVVSPEDWHRLQEILSAGKTRPARREPTLLGGLQIFVCATCGGGMAGDRSTGKNGSYRCTAHRHKGPSVCPGNSVAMPYVDAYVEEVTRRELLALDPVEPGDRRRLEAIAVRYGEAHADPADVAARRIARATLEDAEAALDRLDDDRAAGAFPGDAGRSRYIRQAERLTARIDAARRQVEALAPRPADDFGAVLDMITALRPDPASGREETAPWETWSWLDRRDLFALVFDRIEVLKTASAHGHGGNARWRPERRIRLVFAGETVPFQRPHARRRDTPRGEQLRAASDAW